MVVRPQQGWNTAANDPIDEYLDFRRELRQALRQLDPGALRGVVRRWAGPRDVQLVTTAGSKRLARKRAPAEKDASCLAIARQRNVQIVGKANLSEFALAPSGFNEYFGTPRKSAQQLAQAAPGRFELRFGGGRGEWNG